MTKFTKSPDDFQYMTNLAPRVVDKSNAAAQVLDDLRKQIQSGQYAKGARLPTEKALGVAYGVSGATVREALRGLASLHLVEVRHGSGSYVTADSGHLIALSLHSMIQLERVGVPEVLGVLGVLNAYAAELAAVHATAADVQAMQAALDQVADAASPECVARGLSDFLQRLAEASRNPLLVVLCKFLAGLQIGLAREIARGSLDQWRQTTAQLKGERQKLLDAIRKKDIEAAKQHARSYHERSLKVITALPQARSARLSQQALDNLLVSFTQRSA